MGAFDTLVAAKVPCPSCGDLYWEQCQTKFFDPDYEDSKDLRPGEGRDVPYDPAEIDRAEVWGDSWLRIGAAARSGRFTLMLCEWERRTCSCGAVLMPVAHLTTRTTGEGCGHVTFERMELCDLRGPMALVGIDFVDYDVHRAAADETWTYARFSALGELSRDLRRARTAEAIAATMVPPATDASGADTDGQDWTTVVGPMRCEACGLVRIRDALLWVSHPHEGRFFGDAWAGGTLAPGSRLGPIPREVDTDRLRGRFFRLRDPVAAELTFLDLRHSFGCRCGAGPASIRTRFRRDGDHLVLEETTWRAVHTAEDLADIDWVETRQGGYLARTDIDDLDRLRAVRIEYTGTD